MKFFAALAHSLRFPALLLIVLPAFVFAGGHGEAELVDVEGDRNWSQTFDISGKKQGTYNLIAEGRDTAGNITVAGPFNVYVDPKSDLPIAMIANPLEGMRVSGDLNIVGTCVDDDGVDRVEVRIDEGEWTAAAGDAFWSMYVRSGEIPDGRRKLAVRGVDIHGVTGPTHTIFFDMDRSRPGASFAAPKAGSLVAGRIELEGTVTDDNGVVKAELSLDGGETYVPVKGKWDKKRKQFPFSADIDTRKLPDGPRAILIRAEDGTGSVGITPTLFVVDNTKPAIALVSPGAEETVDRAFTLLGTATDDVAVASLSWRSGKLGGDIPLTAGDPHWTVPIVLPEAKGKDVEVLLTALDTIGNRTELKVRLPLDLESDKPVSTILEPLGTQAAPARTDGAVVLSGFARDDDGVAAVEYWVDKGTPVRLETTGAFSVSIDGLAAGKRLLNVLAIDIRGTAGPTAQAVAEDIGFAPTLRIAEAVLGVGSKELRSEPFVPGMELAPDSGAALRLEADGGSKLESLVYSFSGSSERTLSAKGSGVQSFVVPLPPEGPYGSLEFTAELKDSGGRSARIRTHVYMTNYAAVRGDPEFLFTDERLEPDGTMRFGQSAEPLAGRFVGAVPASIALDPEAPGFTVRLEDNRVLIVPPAQGVSGPHVLTATTDRGHTFRSAPLRLIADAVGPDLVPNAAASPYIGNGPLVLSGRVSDPTGLESLTYRVLGAGGDAPASGDLALPADASGAFSHELDLSAVPDGPIMVELGAADTAGNRSIRTLRFYKDTVPPEVSFLVPPSGPDGSTAAFFVGDPGGVAAVSYGREGEEFRPLEGSEAFVLPLDGAGILVKATDRAGNERTVPVPEGGGDAGLPAITAGAPPAVQILFPAASAGPKSILFFRVAADKAISQVSWSLGSRKGTLGPESLRPVGAASSGGEGGVFTGAVVVENYLAKAGPATATVTAKNSAGKSGSASVKFAYDGGETVAPRVSLTAPAEGESVGPDSAATVVGTAPSGIASYSLVLDGKQSMSAEGPAGVAFALEGLSVGTHTIELSATDLLGRKSAAVKRTFKVLGQKPQVEALALVRKTSRTELVNGGTAAIDGNTVLEGTLRAPNGVESVSVRIGDRPAQKAAVKKLPSGGFSFTAALPQDLPFARNVLTVEVSDPSGAAGTRALAFHRVAEVADPMRYDAEGLYAADLRAEAEEGKVHFDTPEPLVLRFIGRPIQEVRIEPSQSVAAVSFQGALVRLEPSAEGIGAPASVVARTVDGDEFSWGPVSFVVDRADPVFTLEEPKEDGWYRDMLPLAISYSAESGIDRFEWSLDGGEWAVLELSPDEARPELRRAELPFPGTDGGRLLRIRAVDAAGRSSEVLRPVNRDTEAPSGRIILPPEGAVMNGKVSLSAEFSDAGALSYLEFSDDGGTTWTRAEEKSVLSRAVDLGAQVAEQAEEQPAEPADVSRFRFRAADAAGNSAELTASFPVDAEADKPRVLLQLPEENEVLRSDFSISGAVFDDDGIAAVHYRIDDAEFLRLPVEGNSFSIPVALAESEDNEHTVEVYGEDMYGVLGDTAARTYRISKEEPKAAVALPTLDTTVRGIIDITGVSSDANGIELVELSFDNAATFNMVSGTEEWSYRLDTRNLKDGLHSIYLRPKDGYGTTGFYAALISVDNTPPEVTLDLPTDLSIHRNALPLSGSVSDDRALALCEATVFRRGSQGDADLKTFPLGLEPVVSETLDLSGLPNGEYGVRITARDEAGNETVSSRDFVLDGSFRDESIALASPVRGEYLYGKVRVQGFLRSPEMPSAVAILVDGLDAASAEPKANGWFSVDLEADALSEGPHSVVPRFTAPDGRVVEGEPVDIRFAAGGPWVHADAFASGDYVPARPWLSGIAGWVQGPEDEARDAQELAAIAKEGDRKKAAAALRKGREIESVEVSLDNGRTFKEARGGAKWKFRLETQEYPEGPLPLVVRVRLKNGDSAVSKVMLNLDKTPPTVSILAPTEGGRFNETLSVYGIASDDVELASVQVALRDGDKAGYEVPAFIQGLYLDAGVLGDSTFNAGVGLTFFEDNVKLQVSYGSTQAESNGVQQRYFGNVISGKLLANVASLPFSYVLGPDWSFLSANVAVGAKFSYFSETSSGVPLMLSSVVGQLEFPKFTLANLNAFSSYSLYTEFQAWFISAEVDGGVAFRLSFGLRTSVF